MYSPNQDMQNDEDQSRTRAVVRHSECPLQAANISKERLAGFDRPIRSKPKFTQQQCAGLKKDLTAYLQTLKASHCPSHSPLTDATHSITMMISGTS